MKKIINLAQAKKSHSKEILKDPDVVAALELNFIITL